MEETERVALVKKYRRSIKALEKTLDAIPKKAWGFKPEPKEWSIDQIIIHLLDTEIVSFNRARAMIAHPELTVMGMDADEYADNLNYDKADVKKALRLLKFFVEFMTEWLKTLPLEAFQTKAVHPQWEDGYDLEKWLKHFSDHTYTHIDQINNNYKIWKKNRK